MLFLSIFLLFNCCVFWGFLRFARNDRRGARNDRRGVRNDRRGARNDRRGARNDRRGARNDRRGARSDSIRSGLKGVYRETERIQFERQAVQKRLRFKRRVVWPETKGIVLEAKGIVTEIRRLVRRERDYLLGCILNSLEAFVLLVELGARRLKYLGIFVRLAKVMPYGSVVVLDRVTVFIEDGSVEVGGVGDSSGARVLREPLVRHEHVGINVRHGGGRYHSRLARARCDRKDKNEQHYRTNLHTTSTGLRSCS